MKKWRKCKSFASILLCICLLFTMLPVSGRAGVYAAETEANEEVLTEVYTLIEEAGEDGETDGQLAGSLLDEIRELLGNPSDILAKLKELLGSPSDFLNRIGEMLGGSDNIREMIKQLLQDPAKTLQMIKSMIEAYLDKGSITSIVGEVVRPEVGKPYTAASLIKAEAEAEYFVERAVYVRDGVESEEARTFAAYEDFQIRVTFRANQGTRFAGTIFFSMIDNATDWKVEKADRGLADGESRAYVLINMRALKKQGPIEKVTLNIEAPLSGQSSEDFEPYVTKPEADSYELSGSSWVDSSGQFLEEPVTFEAGKTYYAVCGVSAEENCTFTKDTAVAVSGGSVQGSLSIDDESPQSAAVLVAVEAKQAPEGLVSKVRLSLSRPLVGTVYTQKGTESLTPELGLAIPEGEPYEFARNPVHAWFLGYSVDGMTAITGTHTIEPLESNTVYTEVKLKDAGSFFERALVEVEDANVEKVELINESTLGITFDFVIREDINVMVSDSENHVGRGGTVLLETIDPTGASEREEEVYDAYSISKSGGGYSYRLTATPEEGYTFKGWYKGNSGWMDDEENPLPAYYRDSLISAETSYSYEVTWGGDVCFCAVFEEGGGIALNKTAAKILVGKTLQLKATPADAGLKWATDEPEIASVSKTGLVTAHYPGTARIQVSAANGASAICTVTVTFRYVYQCEKNGVYRYTTNVKLARELKAAGWTAAKVLRAPGLSKTKVYWVYNKSTKRYRWTTDLAYAKKMKNAGNKAGLAFYSADVKTVPVYELQKGKTYFYTMKKSVAKSMKNSGWTYVGIAWYAQPT